jgi:hypothetical protein
MNSKNWMLILRRIFKVDFCTCYNAVALEQEVKLSDSDIFEIFAILPTI